MIVYLLGEQAYKKGNLREYPITYFCKYIIFLKTYLDEEIG